MSLPTVSAQDSGIYNVQDYGTIADGKTLNTMPFTLFQILIEY